MDVLLYGKNPTDHGKVLGEEQHDLDPGVSCGEAARAAIGDALAAWGVDDSNGEASLCVSELVAGLCEGRPDRLELRLRCGERSVRVFVRPYGADRSVNELLADETTGRRFTVVDRLAPFWGVLPRPSGEVVWVEFPRS